MGHVKRIWYLLPMRAAKVQASLRGCAVSPEPPLLAHTSSESRGTFTQKARSLAPLNDWACAVKICHDGMLEDTNSLDAAHIKELYSTLLHFHGYQNLLAFNILTNKWQDNILIKSVELRPIRGQNTCSYLNVIPQNMYCIIKPLFHTAFLLARKKMKGPMRMLVSIDNMQETRSKVNGWKKKKRIANNQGFCFQLFYFVS